MVLNPNDQVDTAHVCCYCKCMPQFDDSHSDCEKIFTEVVCIVGISSNQYVDQLMVCHRVSNHLQQLIDLYSRVLYRDSACSTVTVTAVSCYLFVDND